VDMAIFSFFLFVLDLHVSNFFFLDLHVPIFSIAMSFL
jgi:hypothetical protein